MKLPIKIQKAVSTGYSGAVNPGWLLALSVDAAISSVCVCESCTKFPIGGMYAILAQAL